jgi:hypothetical protein
MVVKSQGRLADDHRGRLGLALGSVIADNLRGRGRLSRHFERLIIHDAAPRPAGSALNGLPVALRRT